MKLYILLDPDKPTRSKVGITKNLDQRLRTYRTQSPQCRYHIAYDIPNKDVEKQVFYHLKGAFYTDREYVHAAPLAVERVVECVLEELGIIE